MNSHMFQTDASRRGQSGAALVVGLLLLLVLTILAISGMTTASLEMLMAGNEQYQERAFQAADSAVERAIITGVYNTNITVGGYTPSGDPNLPPTPTRGTHCRPLAVAAAMTAVSKTLSGDTAFVPSGGSD